MSDDAPEQSSKTEDPSQKKLDDAHKRGDVVKSQEVNNWFMIAGSGLLFSLMAAPTTTGLADSLKTLLANADQFEIGGPALGNFFSSLAMTIMLVALVPLVVLAGFGIAANLVQHRPLLSVEPLTPKLSKISPIEGGKRLFSRDALVNFAKGLVKLAVVGGVVFAVLWPEQDKLETMVTLDPAMLRPGRVDRQYKVGYPHKDGRRATFEYYLDKVSNDLTAEEVDKLATITPYFSGASIKDIVNEGLVMVASPPEELDRYFRGEEERWRKVIQDAGITAE